MKRRLFPLFITLLTLCFLAPVAWADSAEDALVAAAEEFVDHLANGRFKKAVVPFDAAMMGAAPPDKLREIWFDLIKQAGAFRQRTESRVENAGVFTFVFVPCRFDNQSLEVKVVFDSEARIAGMFLTEPKADWQAPAYVKAGSFTEEEVMVGESPWELPGTLTIPWGDGPYPAVVLVHGSGPGDRDESVGPNKPFKDIAWGLASEGIAVLRYEKRTRHHALKLTGSSISVTVEQETIVDALAAVELLRANRDVDPERVFIAGHSLGGYLAPRIGARDPAIAGLILLAAPARPMEDLILEQVEYLSRVDGEVTAEEVSQLVEIRKQVKLIKSYALGPDTPRDLLPLGVPATYWLDLRHYDPVETAASLEMPMLILHAGRDYQVTNADFALWSKAFAKEPRVRRQILADLNHLFMIGEGKSRPEEYQQVGHVSPQALRSIVGWIKN